MMLQGPKSKMRKVSLEQLLHLKRSERPVPAFWDEFERELRRRQLAALVTIKPWHERAGQMFLRALRRMAPVGAAAAALAAGVVVWNHGEIVPQSAYAAEIDADSQLIMLPEERVTLSQSADPSSLNMPARAAAQWSPARHGVQEFASSVDHSGAFRMVASPYTLSISDHDAGVHGVRAFTTDLASLPASLQQAGGSF